MSVQDERNWLVKAIIIITGAILLFFLIAPWLPGRVSYPLTRDDSVKLMQNTAPVFFGYLSAAAAYAAATRQSTRGTAPAEAEVSGLIHTLVRWPIYVFSGLFVLILFLFWYANNENAPEDRAQMSVGELANWMTVIMSLLAATTGSVVSYLFAVENRNERGPENSSS